MTLKVTDGHLS